MKVTSTIGLVSTLAIAALLVFSVAYSYEEVTGSSVHLVVEQVSVNYSFGGINATVIANATTSGIIPVTVSALGRTAQVIAGTISHFILNETLNLSSLYQKGFPKFSINIPLNLTVTLASLFFSSLVNFDLGNVNVTSPFSNLALNLSSQGNGTFGISGFANYLWNYSFGEISARLLNSGAAVGTILIDNALPGMVSFSGSANLVGSLFDLVIQNLTIPLQNNGAGQLVIYGG